nr:unnamed protein product [Callosobruchus analis]
MHLVNISIARSSLPPVRLSCYVPPSSVAHHSKGRATAAPPYSRQSRPATMTALRHTSTPTVTTTTTTRLRSRIRIKISVTLTVQAVPARDGMALFGMVWLLRVRSEMKRCAKCRRDSQEWMERQSQQRQQRTPASCSTFFTIDAPPPGVDTMTVATVTDADILGPTTYCEVHGFNPPKEGNESPAACLISVYRIVS